MRRGGRYAPFFAPDASRLAPFLQRVALQRLSMCPESIVTPSIDLKLRSNVATVAPCIRRCKGSMPQRTSLMPFSRKETSSAAAGGGAPPPFASMDISSAPIHDSRSPTLLQRKRYERSVVASSSSAGKRANELGQRARQAGTLQPVCTTRQAIDGEYVASAFCRQGVQYYALCVVQLSTHLSLLDLSSWADSPSHE